MSVESAHVAISVNSIAKVIADVIQWLQFLDKTAKAFGRKSALLNQNPAELNLRDKQLHVAEQFAKELERISPQIDELASELRRNCTRLEWGFNKYTSRKDFEDAVGIENVQCTLTSLQDSKDNLVGTIEELENIRDNTSRFRVFISEYVGEVRDIDGPLGSSTTALSNLIAALKHFDSVSTSIADRHR